MQLAVKSIKVREAEKIKLGYWVRHWEGEDKRNITTIRDGIVVKNRKENRWLDVLDPINGEVDVICYEQVLQVGNLVSLEDTGLVSQVLYT